MFRQVLALLNPVIYFFKLTPVNTVMVPEIMNMRLKVVKCSFKCRWSLSVYVVQSDSAYCCRSLGSGQLSILMRGIRLAFRFSGLPNKWINDPTYSLWSSTSPPSPTCFPFSASLGEEKISWMNDLTVAGPISIWAVLASWQDSWPDSPNWSGIRLTYSTLLWIWTQSCTH